MRDFFRLRQLGGWGLAAWSLVYRLLYPPLFLATMPSWLARMLRRGGWREQFGERFGWFAPKIRPADESAPRPVFVHAVSVGEMFIALKLVDALRREAPELPVVLSTTTTTGMAQARSANRPGVELVYHPFDFAFAARRTLARFRPAAIFYVEAAPWPGMLLAAVAEGVPVGVVNARVSPRSRKRYLGLRGLLRPLFSQLAGVGVTDPGDVGFWREMGVDESRVRVTGNAKYEVSPPDEGTVRTLRTFLTENGMGERRPLLLAASTFPGEEDLLVVCHKELRVRHPDLLTVLVPRHAERRETIAESLRASGLPWIMKSRAATAFTEGAEILLADTTGELKAWFALADAVFIGKSLCARGGQNPIEALAAGKVPIFGPFMENFRALADDLVREHLAIRIQDAAGLAAELSKSLSEANSAGAAAGDFQERVNRLMDSHRRAAERTAALIVERVRAGEPQKK